VLSLPCPVFKLFSRYLVLLAALGSGMSTAAEPIVRIGTGDWLPYIDQHRADGGALLRLTRAIFSAAGYQTEFVYYPWDRNLLMLEHGTLDVVMPYLCSPARQRISTCSDALVRGEVVLFKRADKVLDWTRVEDLRGLRVATLLGYFYGPQLDAALQAGSLQVQQGNKEETAFRLLLLDRVDIYPQDRAVGYALLNRAFTPQERAKITHHPRILHTEPLHVLFRKGDPRAETLREVFNNGLRRLAASGELDQLQLALNAGNADQWQPSP